MALKPSKDQRDFEMKKIIFKNLFVFSVVTTLLLMMLLTIVFYFNASSQLQTQLETNARRMALALAAEETPQQVERMQEWDGGLSSPARLLSPEDEILFENQAAQLSEDPNPKMGEEVQEARTNARGEGEKRYMSWSQESRSLAILLENGNVLWTSSSMDSFGRMILLELPFLLLALLLMLFFERIFARRLTKEIVQPINAFQPMLDESIEYEELAPFVKEIVSQRKTIHQQVESIRDNNQLILQIMENIQEGILLLDREKKIRLANQSACQFLGTKQAVHNKTILEVYRNTEFLDGVDKALLGEKKLLNVKKNGKMIQISFYPSDQSGVLITMIDVSEKERVEKMRREFSANVSHELKTPLTSVRGYAEMMETGMVQVEDMASFAGKIRMEAVRLSDMVEDILLLSRLDERGEGFLSERVAVAMIIDQVCEDWQDKAQQAGIRLTNEYRATPIVEGNPRLLHELFYNIIGNAVKYNKPGGSILVRVEENAEEAKITVQDTGIGIAKQEQERVFERFYRTDKSRSKKTGGTGLGLSIVKHIVHVHNGHITLQSEEGVGTTIEVDLRKAL